MIDLLKKRLTSTTRYVAWLGMFFLLAAMIITTVDVVLRKVDNQGIYGTIDLIQLMIVSAAYLSIPHAFMTKSHVSVSILSDMMAPRYAALSQVLATFLSFCFMLAIAWFGYAQAQMQSEYGDISITLGIPMIYYWVPVLLGSALSAAVTVCIAAEQFPIILNGGPTMLSQDK
ncbi:TRAP transporter small permease [Kiloniella antarctica]|uniref:TRAP transporter small permease protein n=1 Tax=Kiloniella antarctica TaxID=1550907 RepID=A0ABW5BMG7_9PROT